MLATAIVPPHWPFALLLAVTTVARRSPKACAYLLDALGWEADAEFARTLLPGAARLRAPSGDVNNTDQADDEWGVVEKKLDAATTMRQGIKALPTRVQLADVRPFPKSSTALPLGIDSKGKPFSISICTTTRCILACMARVAVARTPCSGCGSSC